MNNPKIIRKFETELSATDLFIKPKMEHFYIRLNNICNAQCEFCDVWRTVEDHDPKIDFDKLVDELLALKVQEVNIHGGEAFLSKAFFSMLEKADSRLRFSITTNGSFLRPQMMDRIVNRGLSRIYLSIDHHDPVENAKSRGIPKIASTLIPNLLDLIKAHPGVEVIINHVVSSFNIDTISTFVTKMKDIGVDAVNLIPIKDYPALNVSEIQIEKFNTDLATLLHSHGVSRTFFLGGNVEIFGTRPEQWRLAARGIYGAVKTSCIVPSAVAFLDAVSGRIFPCDTTMYRQKAEQYVMGNILENSLIDIWNGDRFSAFRKQMYPIVCHDCVVGCDPANMIP